MNITFIEYPPCSTCKKAKKFLLDKGISFTTRHIVEDTPSKEELTQWYNNSSIELKKLFNTSGNLYKEMQLKDTLSTMSVDEQLSLLSQNGMLIKRPLLVYNNQIVVGFKEDNYENFMSRI